MKFPSGTTVTAALLAGSATTTAAAFLPHSAPSFHSTLARRTAAASAVTVPSRSVSFFGTSSALHQSTVADPETVSSSDSVAAAKDDLDDDDDNSKLSGKPIAEGTVVSRFPGGLTAIRVDEELTNGNAAAAAADPIVQTKGIVVEAQSATAVNKNTAANGSSVSGDLLGKQVVFSSSSGSATGVVVAHRPPVAFVYSSSGADDDDDDDDESCVVQVYNDLASIAVSDDVLQTVDCFGRSLVTKTNGDSSSSNNKKKRAIFSPIPQVKDISLINRPMLTGVTMMDALAPIGKGQNMLLVGHDLEQMRGYATDLLQTQVNTNNGKEQTKCIYASTSPYEDLLPRLEKAGIADAVHVVAPTSQTTSDNDISRAGQAVAIAATACAIAEAYALQDDGQDALVVVDNIDQHKTLWDATTRVLVDVFGVEAVVEGDRNGGASSEMRAFYSSLIQRAGQFNARKGGGSVTLLLLTQIPDQQETDGDDEVVYEESDFDQSSDRVKDRIKLLLQRKIPLTADNLRKIDIPIPSDTEGKRRLVLQHVDDLISMTDGQIWLDADLQQEQGQEPPMDPQRSVTRVGIGADTASRADAPALRRVAEGLRLVLSQAANMEGADLATTASQKQTLRQQALLLAMHQKPGTGGRKLSESFAALLAASEGCLDEAVSQGAALAGTDEGTALMEDLLKHLWTESPQLMKEVDESLDITESSQKELLETIESFFSS